MTPKPRKPFVKRTTSPDYHAPRWVRGVHRRWSASAFELARNEPSERVVRLVASYADRLIASLDRWAPVGATLGAVTIYPRDAAP